MNLSGKRLLLLGGGLWKEAIKEYAVSQNITLIATGNDSNSGIFEIADEKYLVDSTNVEEMKSLIKEKNIDGVYMGGSETVISSACQYLNEIGLPCYCTKEQWEFLQNKANFKSLCIEHGLPVVPRYDVYEENITLPENVYPVITKPADGCGSSGFSICRNDIELCLGYEKAKENSESGSVIVEKFVKNDGIVLFLTFSNGKMYFSGIEDKYPVQYKNEGSYVAGLLVFESTCTKEFRDRFEAKIEKMMASIGIKEGSVWIEVFHDGEEFYFNEVGYRYGGTVSAYPVNYYYDINQIASDMYYSLTGKSKIYGHRSLIHDKIERKKYYGVYPIHLNAGRITSASGFEELINNKDIVFVAIAKPLGAEVKQTGSFAQTYALVHFVFDNCTELEQTLDLIDKTLVVKDESGKDMVHRMLDVNKIKPNLEKNYG